MNIAFITRAFPIAENSGVTLASELHAKILLQLGHNLTIVCSHKSILREKILAKKYFVKSHGSGSLYSLPYVDDTKLRLILKNSKPDLVIVESWQTAISDKAILIASELAIPISLISHGVSFDKNNNSIFQILRSLAWYFYKRELKNKMMHLAVLTSLDLNINSPRFYDRDLALKLGVKIVHLPNTAINTVKKIKSYQERKRQIIIVGYYSYIKNQLATIDLIIRSRNDLSFIFVGKKKGSYFEKFKRQITIKNLTKRVKLLSDTECNLSDEIASSLIMLNVSITEAQPISLIEAMAAGTPFIAPNCGAIPSLSGGVIFKNFENLSNLINQVSYNTAMWNKFSKDGIKTFKSKFAKKIIRKNLKDLIESSTSINSNDKRV